MALPWWLDRIVWVVEKKVGNNWVSIEANMTRSDARATARYKKIAGEKVRVIKYAPKV